MDPRLVPLADILGLNTRLLRHCLDGVDDATARQRLTPDTNHLAFLTAHLADARYFLASTLGVPLENPLAAQLEYGKTLDEVGDLPPLSELVAVWDRVSAHLASQIPGLGSPRGSTRIPDSASRSRTGLFWGRWRSWCSTTATTSARWRSCGGNWGSTP